MPSSDWKVKGGLRFSGTKFACPAAKATLALGHSFGGKMAIDVIVVGGGIIGCTHAYFLQSRGLNTVLVERGTIGSGTTANNFSWINASTKTKNPAYHRLNARGVQMYEELAQEFGAETIGLKAFGALGLVRRSSPDFYQSMQDDAKALETLGYPVQWIETDELRQLEPNVAFADDAEAILTPSDKCLNATLFARFMAEKLILTGGQVRENCAALALDVDDNGAVSGVATDHGTLQSRHVVIAVGPNTPEVLSDLTGYDGFAARFPVNKVPGLLVTTPPVRENLIRHLNYTDTDGEFHFMPDFNGGLRLASDDVDGAIIADQSPAHLRQLALGLLRRMQEFVLGFGGEALIDQCALNIGTRAYPADGYSIAGDMPGAQGLYVIATHSGVTLAPALGSLMAELVATGHVPDLLEPFGLDRLPGFG